MFCTGCCLSMPVKFCLFVWFDKFSPEKGVQISKRCAYCFFTLMMANFRKNPPILGTTVVRTSMVVKQSLLVMTICINYFIIF